MRPRVFQPITREEESSPLSLERRPVVYNYKVTLTACTLFLLLTLCGQPAFAQTATSNQDQAITNTQNFNQQAGTQSLTFPESRP